MKGYKTVYRGGVGELMEKKSRFIATVEGIDTEDAAAAVINRCKKKYYDASHNCYGFTLGQNHEIQRFSDDGEPGGTAGRPILDILMREDIHNGVIVVTRYFGGTLLGTGGLIRAYQGAAREGLLASRVIEKIPGMHFFVETDYNNLGRIQYLLNRRKIAILNTAYQENVKIHGILPMGEEAALEKNIMDETSTTARLTMGKREDYALEGEEVLLFEGSEKFL